MSINGLLNTASDLFFNPMNTLNQLASWATTSCVNLELNHGASLSIKKDGSGKLFYELNHDGISIQPGNIIINGINFNDLTEKDVESYFNLLKNNGKFLADFQYDSEKNIIFVSSRPRAIQMIEGGEPNIDPGVIVKYSLIESLDDDYVNCALMPDDQIQEGIKIFEKKYAEILSQIHIEEDCVDIMLRKATLDGLKISLIPSYRFDLFPSACRDVIKQFSDIENKIKILNLAIDKRESLDFHMYRGFVYSRFSPDNYPDQRKIAVSDAMLTIYCTEQLLKNKDFQPTPIFYKKMAHAFKVFARGVDNPPISLEFIRLSLQFIDACQRMQVVEDQNLVTLKKVVLDLKDKFDVEDSKEIKINIDSFKNFPDELGISARLEAQLQITGIQQSIRKNKRSRSAFEEVQVVSEFQPEIEAKPLQKRTQKNETPSNEVNTMIIQSHAEIPDPFDLTLLKIFQEFDDDSKEISNLKNCISEMKYYQLKDNVEKFRLRFRLLFLENYLSYLINKNNFISSFETTISKFNQLIKSLPDNFLCQTEFHLFRGCVLIGCPRTRYTMNYYNNAIDDFNKSIDKDLPLDLRAFQFMTYGSSMLPYNPFTAVKLLQQAISLAKDDGIKLRSRKILKDFFENLAPIHPSLGIDPARMIQM